MADEQITAYDQHILAALIRIADALEKIAGTNNVTMPRSYDRTRSNVSVIERINEFESLKKPKE